METNVLKSDINEYINEYYKLKNNYESQIMTFKKKIINNQQLSNREKRSEFLKLKPKCINCKRPGGTIFKTIFIPEKENEILFPFKKLTAKCGIITEPCNLNIEINVGNFSTLPDLLDDTQKNIKQLKDELINNKNKLLFGYITTEEALEGFEILKDNISEWSSLYEIYLEKYNEIVDNDEKKRELEKTITDSYIQINEIKDCIKKMNETNNVQFARDAVNIYTTTLTPLLNAIRTMKYDETYTYLNDKYNTCNLIQNPNSIKNLLFSNYDSNVSNFNTGFEIKQKKKSSTKKAKKLEVSLVESSDTEEY